MICLCSLLCRPGRWELVWGGRFSWQRQPQVSHRKWVGSESDRPVDSPALVLSIQARAWSTRGDSLGARRQVAGPSAGAVCATEEIWVGMATPTGTLGPWEQAPPPQGKPGLVGSILLWDVAGGHSQGIWAAVPALQPPGTFTPWVGSPTAQGSGAGASMSPSGLGVGTELMHTSNGGLAHEVGGPGWGEAREQGGRRPGGRDGRRGPQSCGPAGEQALGCVVRAGRC